MHIEGAYSSSWETHGEHRPRASMRMLSRASYIHIFDIFVGALLVGTSSKPLLLNFVARGFNRRAATAHNSYAIGLATRVASLHRLFTRELLCCIPKPFPD